MPADEGKTPRHDNGGANGSASKSIKSEESRSRTKSARKRPSPFRIKVGCVVALRVKPDGNQLSKVNSDGKINQIFPDDTLIPVWTNPFRDRDEGLALVGKRVRCFLPKHIVEEKKSRILEGEIIHVYERLKHSNDKPWKVDLLVDKSVLADFPFLVRTDEDIDLSQLPSEKARNHARLEEKIRGANKCAVRLSLMRPGSIEGKKALKWVIQKIVPRRLLQATTSNPTNGSTTNVDPGQVVTEEAKSDEKLTAEGNGSLHGVEEARPAKKKRKVNHNIVKYIGDKDDTDEQQTTNWRWMTSRYHNMILTSEKLREGMTAAQMLSLGFIGEVIKVAKHDQESSSLANVTIRRLILPQQTVNCSSPVLTHGVVFDDIDSSHQVLFQVPVEELVVLSRKLRRPEHEAGGATRASRDDTAVSDPIFSCDWAYSYKLNAFIPNMSGDPTVQFNGDALICHKCRRAVQGDNTSESCCRSECPHGEALGRAIFCVECSEFLKRASSNRCTDGEMPSCLRNCCDCLVCRMRRSNDASSKSLQDVQRPILLMDKDASLTDMFQSAVQSVSARGLVDFGLPKSLINWENTPAPASKPVTRPKSFGQKVSAKVTSKRKSARVDVKADEGSFIPQSTSADVDGIPGVGACARLLPYHALQSMKKTSCQTGMLGELDRPRNLRQRVVDAAAAVDLEGSTDRRAERAKQRRLLKGMASFSNFDVDTLASREPQLRFDRSSIHAWGVFADKDISSGDMIVEYRGEIIEQAVAEKRDKLYEAAKIGSDYMFRIDGRFLCDATKVGNVARFLNASCDPNCYTKIINVDGQKRIVIYAKKDIPAGEELCYDYKFPLEYDPAKRVPCHCGASNCRGFMNWDKKYVSVNSPDDSSPKPSESLTPNGRALSEQVVTHHGEDEEK